MAMAIADIEAMIRAALPDAKVEVRDLAGDGEHYAAKVVSPAFKGQEPGATAPVGLCGAERPHGRRAACAGADDSGGVNEGADLRTRSAASAAAFCRDKACAGHETS